MYLITPINGTQGFSPQLIKLVIFLIQRAFQLKMLNGSLCNFTLQSSSEKLSHSFDMNNSSGFWSNHQKLLNIGISVSLWLNNQMNSKKTQHLIEPLPVFLQWLRDRKVSAKISAHGLIFVFLYSTNKLAASKLIIPVVEGHRTKPNVLKANILCFSNLAPGLAF